MREFDTFEEKFDYMTKTPVSKLIGSLAVPTMISMLITSIYNMADTFFVGKVSTTSMAAVGVVFSLMAVIQATGFFCGQGSGSYISTKLGEKNIEDASRMTAVGFFTALSIGILISVIGFMFLDDIIWLLGSTDTIFPEAKNYAKYILLGAPFMTSQFVLNSQLRFQGNAFYSMLGIVSGGIINIILDPIFIFIFDMGAGGAGLATAISQFISFCIMFIGTFRSSNIKVNPKYFTLEFSYYREMFFRGFPSLCRQGLASVATILLNVSAGMFGDVAIASMSIVTRISYFINAMVVGFGQGFQPVCTFNYGAKEYRRIYDGFFFCVKSCTILMLVLTVICYTNSNFLISLFRDEKIVIEIGSRALKLQCISFPLMSFSIITDMIFQALKITKKSIFIAIARQGLFFIPILLISNHFYGLLGIEMAQSLANIASFLVALPLAMGILKYFKINKNFKKNLNSCVY